MPVETRVRAEFGHLVRQIMEGDTYGKAAIKTGISQAYLLAMGRGQVPTRSFVEKFAKGYKVSSEDLLIAGGYEESTDPLERIEIALLAQVDCLTRESRKSGKPRK